MAFWIFIDTTTKELIDDTVIEQDDAPTPDDGQDVVQAIQGFPEAYNWDSETLSFNPKPGHGLTLDLKISPGLEISQLLDCLVNNGTITTDDRDNILVGTYSP